MFVCEENCRTLIETAEIKLGKAEHEKWNVCEVKLDENEWYEGLKLKLEIKACQTEYFKKELKVKDRMNENKKKRKI